MSHHACFKKLARLAEHAFHSGLSPTSRLRYCTSKSVETTLATTSKKTFTHFVSRHSQTLCYKQAIPYQAHCEATTFSLVNTLGLTPEQYNLCNQSTFGYINGCKPALNTVLQQITEKKYSRGRCDCPGFAIDCY